MTDCTLAQFLEAFFSGMNGGFIEARLINSTGQAHSYFHESVAQFIAAAPTSLEDQLGFNVYFGVCPRSRKAGTKDAIKIVGCLWADLDAKDFSGGKPEALKRLQDFALLPSIIVDSGHGYHAYWLFNEAEDIAIADDIQKIESYLKALATALGADLHAAELARVLRVPGTYNVKNLAEPSSPPSCISSRSANIT